MDLVFKRYSSPFLLLDNLIENGRFLEFIIDLLDMYEEEQIYELWLHKCFDKSYEEFKKGLKKQETDVEEVQSMDDERIGSIINDSFEILNNFKPC